MTNYKDIKKVVKERDIRDLVCICTYRELVVIDHTKGEEIQTCGKCNKRIYD